MKSSEEEKIPGRLWVPSFRKTVDRGGSELGIPSTIETERREGTHWEENAGALGSKSDRVPLGSPGVHDNKRQHSLTESPPTDLK